jgi:tRNA(Leu) C34 or U34 (ribose-2'-O)-methylase TrmL
MGESRISIGLCNPKSPTNVGAVMRAAGCFGADAVYYTGERYDRAAPFAAPFNTDTQDAACRIPLTWAASLLEAAPENAKLVCIELVEGAIPLPEYQHPDSAFYVFGPEDGTLRQQVIDSADAVVFIPTTGCLNLAATVNVVLYDRIAKSPHTVISDERIRQSRDFNNRLKVKNS